jgi:HK97 family phage portal protein
VQIRTPGGGYETRAANPYQPYGSTAPPPPGVDSFGGIQVNERSALQQVSVWGAVSLISDSIATLPIQQWKLTGDEPKQIDPSPVIARPWAEIDQIDFVQQGTMSMLLRGNLWGRRIGMDPWGCPEQVQLIHPDHARIRRNTDGQIEVKYWNDVIPNDQVIHKMALSVPEGIEGLSPISYLRNTIGLARAQDLYANAFFANSARSDGWIGVQDSLDEDEIKAMLAAYLGAHQGINNAFLPLILTEGAEFHPITMSMVDAQFLEQIQLSASDITGKIFRIPPHMLGMVDKDTSWGAGIEQQMLGYVRDCLGIWLRRWEDVMTSWLPPKQFVTFDLSQRLRGDALQRWSAYQIARVIGVMNGAEVRAAEGLPKVTDPTAAALLDAYDTPFTSSPVKPAGGNLGGDKAA